MFAGLGVVVCVLLSSSLPAQQAPVIRDCHYPALSPDGSRVAFSYQGDVWVAEVATGDSRRLTLSDAYDSRPRFSPDGRQLAFVSDRYGNSDLFTMPAGGGEIQRVTYHSAGDTLSDWSPDGTKLLFSSARDHDRLAPYEIELKTGYVHPLLRDVCSVSANSYSPDGRYVVGIRDGATWWRKGYTGSANAELALYDTRQDTLKLLTDNPGMDNWPVMSADGKRVFFVSERNCRPNVFEMNLADSRVRQLTSFDTDAVTFLQISRDGKWLAFEWNFDLWRMPTTGGTPTKIVLHAPIDYRQTFETDTTLTDGIQEMEVNRDGSLVAIRVRDDIFFVKPELKNDSIRLTDWQGFEGDYFWSPDGKQLAYTTQQEPAESIWVVDGATRQKRRLVHDAKFYLDLMGYTPDGKKLLFRHNAGGDGIFAADPQTGEVTQFLSDPNVQAVRISPDGRWVLAQIDDQRSGTDLFVKPLAGGEWVNITREPKGSWTPWWSPDGKRIYFACGREGNTEIYSVELQREPAKFEDYEQQLADKEKEKKEKEKEKKAEKPATPAPETKPATPATEENKPKTEEKTAAEKTEEKAWKYTTIDPFEIDFTEIHERAKRLTNTPENESSLIVTPDGKTLLYLKGREIWAMDPDGKNQRRLVNGSFDLGALRLQEDGKALFFLDGGKLKKAPIAGGNPTDISWKAKIHTDDRLVQKEALRQAWAMLDESFYSADLHGVDWPAQYKRYSQLCDGTLGRDDLQHLIGRMIGELDGSHLGISGGTAPTGPSTASLGIVADPKHRGPGIKVLEVLPNGPLDLPESKVTAGEYLLSVDGKEVSNNEDFYRLFANREGERMKLKVNKEPTAEGAREISVKPISLGTLGELRYQDWLRRNREMTTKLSGGKVYYLHIRSMDDASFTRFERELNGAAQHCEALLLDVRNNGGGNTHDRLLEDLTKTVHAWNAARNTPLRSSPFSQFDGPKALLINEHSASDAEIFPNGFRQKGLGPLVGRSTSGMVIGTSDRTLVNGFRFRVPWVGWYTMDGIDLENMGVKPDCEVPFSYEDYRAGKDPQIEKAVSLLMEALQKTGGRKQPARPMAG
jgi:tricorn protease